MNLSVVSLTSGQNVKNPRVYQTIYTLYPQVTSLMSDDRWTWIEHWHPSWHLKSTPISIVYPSPLITHWLGFSNLDSFQPITNDLSVITQCPLYTLLKYWQFSANWQTRMTHFTTNRVVITLVIPPPVTPDWVEATSMNTHHTFAVT